MSIHNNKEKAPKVIANAVCTLARENAQYHEDDISVIWFSVFGL